LSIIAKQAETKQTLDIIIKKEEATN
jgi:hypothetical protein